MNILDTIVAQKRLEIERLEPEPVTASGLQALLQARNDLRDFTGALQRPAGQVVSLIAEVKKASPSAGVIRADFDPVRIAREYEKAGAQCVSVLTDERFFQGALSYLQAIRQSIKLPLLRKDFIIDARQIREAVQWGADAILLIVAILDDDQLAPLHDLAINAGLAVLVEVHDEEELARAVAAGARLIGINNRNLKTFKVDLGTTERLAGILRTMPGGQNVLVVAESGIHSRADVQRVVQSGAQAILVGESLMKEKDISAKIQELVKDCTCQVPV